jgi:hypothetical protein
MPNVPQQFVLQISSEVNEMLEAMCLTHGSSRTDIVRQALALIKIAHDAKKAGFYIGLVDDPAKLNTEIVGLFQ